MIRCRDRERKRKAKELKPKVLLTLRQKLTIQKQLIKWNVKKNSTEEFRAKVKADVENLPDGILVISAKEIADAKLSFKNQNNNKYCTKSVIAKEIENKNKSLFNVFNVGEDPEAIMMKKTISFIKHNVLDPAHVLEVIDSHIVY